MCVCVCVCLSICANEFEGEGIGLGNWRVFEVVMSFSMIQYATLDSYTL